MTFIKNIITAFTSLFFLLLITLIASCGPGRKVVSKQVTLDTISVSAANNPIDIYRASAPREWDIIHTRVALSFNFKEKTANGREWLSLHPYFYTTDSLVLDAKDMQIDTVSFAGNGPEAAKLSYTYADDKLHIKFSKHFIAVDIIQLYISYKAMPYKEPVGGSSAITEDRGLYFINTDHAIPGKPVQIWTQGETESNSHWLPTIDKPNTRFTVQVELTVPDSMQTLSNGFLQIQQHHDNGMRTDIWLMDKPIQAYAVMFAIGRYAIVKDNWQGREVNYYVEPEYEPYARLMFQHTPEMMDFFSNATGVPYPWNKYDQVVVRDYVSGAMENTTASLFGEFMNQNSREHADHDYEDIVSHELFHMWFGDYVTCESWSNLTLNESFADYGEYLWRNYKYGKNSADRLAYTSLLKYLAQARQKDPPLVRFYYADREDMFDRVSYEKGGLTLRYLHGLMGDDAFFKAMQLYLTHNALHSAEATQWRLAVEEATGKDWNWFFNQWYYRGGHPILDIRYVYDDADAQLVVTVTQAQDSGLYKLPLKTVVIYGAERKLEDWEITKKKQVFTYKYHNNIRPTIVPDVLHWLPGRMLEDKPMAQWLTEYVIGSDYITRRLAIDAAYKDINDSVSHLIFDRALSEEYMPAIRAYALSLLFNVTDDVLQRRWHGQVQYIAEKDPNNEARASAYDVLGAWKYRNAKADMLAAVSDSSYNVAGSALGALYKIDEDTAYAIAKDMLDTDPKAQLEASIWDIIAKRADSTDFSIYKSRADHVYGGQKMRLVASLSSYLGHVKSDRVFEDGLKTMEAMIKAENIKNYRYYMGYYLFEVAKNYKAKKETDTTKQRIALTRQYIRHVIDAEQDPDNKKKYDDLQKEVFTN
jgi:aminopeptidase N